MNIRQTDKFLTREDTKVIKAIAIILMLMHHLWAFPDRIAGGSLKYLFHIFGQSSIEYLGGFGKICVSLFFFLGGYGIYLSSAGKKFDVVKKIKKLYVAYWKVFLIFIPIAFLFFSSQPAYCKIDWIYNRYGNFSWNQCIANFLGLSSSFNGEWWFLLSYVFAVISFPVIRAIVDKCSPKINILLVLIGSIVVTNLLPAIGNIDSIGTLNNNYIYANFFCQSAPFVACFWMGVVVAKDALLDRLNDAMLKNKLLNLVYDILIWGIAIYLRQTGIGSSMDIFYIPFLIIASINLLNRCKNVKKILLLLGKQSTNMWLIHSFCCYYFYAIVKVVVAPRWALASLIILIGISYILSILVDFLWRIVHFVYQLMKKAQKTATPHD